MSASSPPTGPLLKNSQCPSREKPGALSSPSVLRVGPRFTGTPHGSSWLARRETQRSRPPEPSERSELKYRLSPSLEITGRLSLDAELTTGPRLTGVPQGPSWLGTTRSSSGSTPNRGVALFGEGLLR